MKNKIFNGRAIVIIASTLIILTACSKDNNTREKSYSLTANGTSGVTGQVRITEIQGKKFNLTVDLNKSIKDTLHIVKVYSGRVNSEGDLLIDMGTVKGTGSNLSLSKTQIDSVLINGQNKYFTYDSLVNYNAYVKVLHSAFRPDSVLTKGNIGK
ncbi:hypothetical protein [Flavihumibacter fluvii]|uniref:hypothetical protein n=1 Tax=Flavihumibacter fluvii TaxID=2838157 RepID=UPI001BDE8B82|nr:hypothetical protein [Flavihumibacter fluvii]ULQ51266.1 hypothetical protein KJS93_14340 [Flavihumibacter fluvii]